MAIWVRRVVLRGCFDIGLLVSVLVVGWRVDGREWGMRTKVETVVIVAVLITICFVWGCCFGGAM